jgi:hypothetical protein
MKTEIRSFGALRSDMFDGGGSGGSGSSYYGGSNAQTIKSWVARTGDRDSNNSPSGRFVVTDRDSYW